MIVALVLSCLFGGRYAVAPVQCFTAPVRLAAHLVRNDLGEVVRIEWRAPKPGEPSFRACPHAETGKAAAIVAFAAIETPVPGLRPVTDVIAVTLAVPTPEHPTGVGAIAPETPPPVPSDRSA